MTYPSIAIDLPRIRANAERLRLLCESYGIDLMGVTKGVLGSTPVVRSLLDAGITSIGDSRLDSIAGMREEFPNLHITYIKSPSPPEADRVVGLAEVSFNSDISTLRALDAAARRAGKVHGVIISVEIGELRDGVPINKLPRLVRQLRAMAGLELVGFACNQSCLSGRPAESAPLEDFCDAARAEQPDSLISGGSSSALPLLEAGSLPKSINQLRLGEAVLLGRIPPNGTPWPGLAGDAFILNSLITERYEKDPGDAADAIAATDRAIASIGKADTAPEGLWPLPPAGQVVGFSSDQTIIDVAGSSLSAGDKVSFIPSYDALLRAMTSPFVYKEYIN